MSDLCPLSAPKADIDQVAVAILLNTCPSTHTSMNKRSPRLDDDLDLIAVSVAEPVEGHGPLPSNSALAGPRRYQRFDGEVTKGLVHSLRPCLDVFDDDGHRLTD